jgi:hypothetical protein
MTGGSYPARRQISSIFGRKTAFARCRQFQVNTNVGAALAARLILRPANAAPTFSFHLLQCQSLKRRRLHLLCAAPAHPIRLVQPLLHRPPKRRIRIPMRTRRHPMLHRVKMNIIHVRIEILDVPNPMFPKPPLPNPAPPHLHPRCRASLLHTARRQKLARKLRFNKPQSRRIIPIPTRQLHQQMQMLRKKHHRMNFHRPRFGTFLNRTMQNRPPQIRTKNGRSPLAHQRKEKRPTRHPRPSPVRHADKLPNNKTKCRGDLGRPQTKRAANAPTWLYSIA